MNVVEWLVSMSCMLYEWASVLLSPFALAKLVQ